MPQQFLYEQLDSAKKIGMKRPKISDFLIENLNPKFELREYQNEAFGRFLHCFKNDFEDKEYPLYLLFNMATGSGKTLIMAGLILYLYEQGYRNFLFFVNSTNIIEKTKDNFLNNQSIKYLFNDKIVFNNQRVEISQVNNFDGVNDQKINICFTTIQKLHGDLHNEKENSLTFEDFKDKKIVLISDEAHHTQVQTRNHGNGEEEKPNWENTVEKIFRQNKSNLLLEFTATLLEGATQELIDKYRNKIIYRYDLKEFRNDGYSKDVELFSSHTNKKDRILQAIILSQYRQEVAAKHNINLKPVILFKAQRTIAQSQANKELFHGIIRKLSVNDIRRIRTNSNVPILKNTFNFFKGDNISDSVLVKKLKEGFAENKCLSVNEEKEKEAYQILLNSLEDKNNQVRAIFAVQKLNEGWDVLNLFDIVRLYETRDGKANKPGKTTISEAQLIGRGARYFPFETDDKEDKHKRKYDKNLDHELRVLEELYYHSHDESRYISEIKTALIKEGMMDEKEEEVELKLKDEFKNKSFYKTGLVWANKKVKTDLSKVMSIKDLGVSQRSVRCPVMTGAGRTLRIMENGIDTSSKVLEKSMVYKLSTIETHIIRSALARSEFYNFNNLKKYFPNLKSITDFIKKQEYLATLFIVFIGPDIKEEHIDNELKFRGVLKLLNELEDQIKNSVTDYQGSEEFEASLLKDKFTDKKIKIKKGDRKLDDPESFVRDKEWYVYNANYGTSEERDLVELIEQQIGELRKKHDEIYLVRNERQLKIFDSKGRAFEPDFLLFLKKKSGQKLTYQIFIEPKGAHLVEHDQWKNDFLQEIAKKNKDKIWKISETKKYKVLGLPFYQSGFEEEFKEEMFNAIK